MRAVTWIESSQITSILFKASLPALWVLTLSNSISQPQYCAAIKLTSTSAIFPGNIDSMLHCIARHCQMSILNSKLLKVQSCHGWNEKSKYANMSLIYRVFLSTDISQKQGLPCISFSLKDSNSFIYINFN